MHRTLYVSAGGNESSQYSFRSLRQNQAGFVKIPYEPYKAWHVSKTICTYQASGWVDTISNAQWKTSRCVRR